ncbi:uncharacterized protein [Epargyreus clarus]|uniref:uncharacterized protein n=1 Tax=Epargyreus clarus TaxID=520877 RepID=UPI003C2D9C3C
MMFLGIISTFLVLNVLSKDVITSSENEMDLVIEMLMNNEFSDFKDSPENLLKEKNSAEEPVYADGLWKCGKCDDIDESKLLYTEMYNVEANYDEDYIDLMVGLSLQKMSCVTISGASDEPGDVTRVSGDCMGEDVTLRVAGAAQYEVRAYQ